MEESTFLSRSFADQGLKIRIRRLAKRDRKELELIDHSLSNRLKRHRGDGKRDDDSGDSSDVDMHDRTPNTDDSRSKLNSEINRKDHNSISPSSPRRYDHMPHMHYDPNASMYGPGPGYPPHRPHPWHDRPEYMAEHYPPYYEPYDRRYGYHPYYYPHPPPMPDSAEHHRYPYPAYGRPPMYPTQGPPYYDAPSRVGHPANESQGPVRPYGYDPSSPYPPQRGAPWPHYGERSQSRDPNLESSSSPYRPATPLPPRGHPMYPPYPPHPDYYAPYAHPPMVPPPPKPADYAAQNPSSMTEDPQSKIPIQDLLSTEQQQQQNQSQQNQQQNQLPQQQQQSQSSQPNTEQNSVVPPPHPQQRMYGVPPSAFAHIYPHHPVRPHEYMRHDMYGRPYDVGYPPQPHDAAVSPYGQSAGSSSSPLNKSQPTSQPTSQPPQASQSDTARTSLIQTTSPTQTPSSTSSESVRQESRNAEYNSYDSGRRSTYSSEREPLTSTGNPSVAPSSNSSSTPTSQAPSSYSGMPVMPTATRTGPIALPPLSYMAPSGNSIAYHSATSTSPLHTSTSSSQQLKSPPQLKSPSQTQPPSSYDHPPSYPQSASSSQNRGSYSMTSGSDHGSGNNSSKNNGVNTNLGSGNEKTTTTLSTSPRAAAGFEGKYPRRQGGDVEDFGCQKKHNGHQECKPKSNIYTAMHTQ